MDEKNSKTLAAALGAVGLILILAGPAFHFLPSELGIFLALATWIIAGLVRSMGKEEKKKKKKK